MIKHILAASAVAVALLLAAQSNALAVEGAVHGTNTVDLIGRDSVRGEPVNLTVTATGNGSNKLKVEVQLLRWQNNNWFTIREMFVSPGSTATSSYTVPSDPNHTVVIRYRLSRKIGTQRIDYSLDEN